MCGLSSRRIETSACGSGSIVFNRSPPQTTTNNLNQVLLFYTGLQKDLPLGQLSVTLR